MPAAVVPAAVVPAVDRDAFFRSLATGMLGRLGQENQLIVMPLFESISYLYR
jgi:hypothetical protein